MKMHLDIGISIIASTETSSAVSWNPNCPSSIRKEILASDNQSAKEYLKTIDNGKENGTFFIDENGRWFRYRFTNNGK